MGSGFGENVVDSGSGIEVVEVVDFSSQIQIGHLKFRRCST
jgi:hypothetical protein